MQTFKVGDRVRVDNKGQRISKNQINWPVRMDMFQGLTTTVRSITNGYSCKLLDGGNWNFDNSWLTKVNKFKGNLK